MGTEHDVLAQGLSLAGLLLATLQYSGLMRRREEGRRRVAAALALERQAGLQGLVRVFLADG